MQILVLDFDLDYAKKNEEKKMRDVLCSSDVPRLFTFDHASSHTPQARLSFFEHQPLQDEKAKVPRS